jgi:uncharacterized membrane protein YsdA (DUF1294 family)
LPGFSARHEVEAGARRVSGPKGGGVNGLKMTLVAVAVASALDFALMAWDKLQARRGGRRVPEAWLHLLEFLGGWPGSFAAMQLVAHKRSKPAFWGVSVAIACLHLGAWTLWWLRY